MSTGTEIFRSPRQLKHKRVREFVLEQMVAERLKAGDALPAEGSLAESLGVARNTVRQALGELVREGFIERVQGKGVFVTKEATRPREITAGVFGLILPEQRGSFYPSLIKGFGEVAGQSQCSLFICETGNDVGRQGDAILQMIDRRVVGVAIVPTTEGAPAHQPRQLDEHGIPFVFCHRGIDDVSGTVISWSWQEVSRLAAAAIVDRGHRRVAFVADVRYRYTQMYEDAFRAALAEHEINLSDECVCYNAHLADPAGEDEARSALVSMLSSRDRPTAVFANDVVVAERVYLEALRLGLRVPEDLSIVGFGGKWREGAIREQLAAVVVDEVRLGSEAARVLNQIRDNRSASSQAVMPLEFLAGKSLAQVGSRIANAQSTHGA